MVNLNMIEKEQKKIFNTLSLEEKQAYYKKLETKFSNYPFLTEEGILIGDLSKCNDLDNMIVKINADSDLNKTVLNASLSVIYDYEALRKKYNEEVLIAFSFYFKSLYYNLEIVDNVIYFLEEFLGVFSEEPSELLYYVLQDVAKATVGTFNKAIVIVDSVLNNSSELAEDVEDNELLFSSFKEQVAEKKSKYNDVLMKILNLEEPEGSVENG